MSQKDTTFTFQVPSNLSEMAKQEIADRVIEEIVARTRSGIGTEGSFTSYTSEYIKEKGSSKVDLTLTRDMLDFMEVISIGEDTISVGYSSSNPEQGKAEGNQLGTYGQSSPIPGKARPFIGLSPSRIELIITEVTAQEDTQVTDTLASIVAAKEATVKQEPSEEELIRIALNAEENKQTVE